MLYRCLQLQRALMLRVGLLSLAVIRVGWTSQAYSSGAMFQSIGDQVLAGTDTTQKNYGIAVADVDNDGEMEWIVAGFSKGNQGAPNLVLKYDHSTGKLRNIAEPNTPYAALRDEAGAAIGVCACDIDGDGREEIYFLNTNGAYGGRAAYGDKLFKWRNGRYVDLLSDNVNAEIQAINFAGRSVACIDRRGNGKYSFALATYSWRGEGALGLIEMDENHPDNDLDRGHIVLRNAAKEAKIAYPTGGRGITAGPIVSDDRSDLFFDNEGGPNFLFKNLGDGTFSNVASATQIEDMYENGRGVALADFNGDGLLDVVYGNWVGPHRLYLQSRDGNGKATFTNAADGEFASPTAVRTVIAADFDNDGALEVLFNNIYYKGQQPNKLFRVNPMGGDVDIRKLDIGDAEEPDGFGTGGAVCDMDKDGVLEVMLSHGESTEQPLSVYKVRPQTGSYLRILPRTQFKAPARGALVTITQHNGRRQTRVIDAGSGYLCQMEPVAHFGLGNSIASYVHVTWPDGTHAGRALGSSDMNKLLEIAYPMKPSSTSGKDVQSLPVYSHDGKTVYLGQKSSNNEAYPSSSPGIHLYNSLKTMLVSLVTMAIVIRPLIIR